MKNKMMVSQSAAGKSIIKLSTSRLVVTADLFKKICPYLAVDLSSSTITALMAKIGLRKPGALLSNTNTFLLKAKPEEKAVVLTAADRKLFVEALLKRVEFHRPELRWSKKPRPYTVVLSRVIAGSVVDFVAVAGVRLAQALGVPHSRAFTEYLITKKSAKAPPTLKALSKAPKSPQAKIDVTALDLTKLRPADFADGNHDLVAALPKMFLAYRAQKQAVAKAQWNAVKAQKKNTFGKDGRRDWTAYDKLHKQQTEFYQLFKKLGEDAGESLKKETTAEMFTFFQHTIPAVRKSAPTASSNELDDLKYELRDKKRLLERLKERKVVKSELDACRAAVAQLTAKYKDAKGKVSEITGKVRPWMHGYVDTPDTKDTGILLHRLVELANKRKLKTGAKELAAVMDSNSALLITYAGIGNILDALGGSTVKAANTVFQNVVETVKPKLFTYEMSESFGRGLDTPTGRVTNQRLLRLNSITNADEKSLVKQYQKAVDAWNPLKLEAADLVKKLDAKPSSKASAYTVTKSSAKQLEAYREDLPHFMTHIHTIGLEIVRAWECEPSPKIAAILKNLRGKKNDLKVIRNVFHGCSKQAGSIILHSGFKLGGTMVTARSMGDVLYMAPNVDKSAQYMGAAGMTRKDNTAGIVFMGDIIVRGAGRTGKIGPNAKASSEYDWTRKSFQTEEIGLVNPNLQFIIRHVFLLRVVKQTHAKSSETKIAKAMLKFEPAIKLSEYLG